MATTIGDLQYTLSLDDKPLQRGSRSAKATLKGLDAAFGRLANISLATQGVTTFGRKLFEFGSTFVNAAADLEKLTQGLTAVAGSSREADEQLDRLRQVAKLPGLGLEEAVQGSINLQAVGLSAEQAESALSAFGNALATVGKGKAELDGVILALTQMAAKGKISAEEINQIGERVPQIRAVMLEAFGTAVPQEIEKMGITADKFIDTVTAKLGALPSVAGGASNAFENLADATRGFQAQLGELILPQVTSMVNDLASTFETLSEAMNTPSEQIRDIATDFEEAKEKFDDQSKSIKDLREEYDDLKSKLDNVNPGTREAARLNTRLQGVITNLISLVPQLAGKLDLETSSFKDLNATIASNLELRRSMLTAEFVTGLDRFTQQVDAAQKRMSELKAAQTELAGLGNQGLVTDAGATRATGTRTVQTEGGEQLSATAQKLVGDSTQVADVLVRVRQEMVKNNGTMDLLAVKFAQVAEAAGEGTVSALRDLAQLQSLGASAATGEYSDALGTMAQRLNLSTATLEKFLPLINQIPEVAQPAAEEVKKLAEAVAAGGDDAEAAKAKLLERAKFFSDTWNAAVLKRRQDAEAAAKQTEKSEAESSKRRLSNAEHANDLEWDSLIRTAIKMGQAEAELTDTLAAEDRKRTDNNLLALAKRVSQFQDYLRRIARANKDAQQRMFVDDTLTSPVGGGIGFGQMEGQENRSLWRSRGLQLFTGDLETAKDMLSEYGNAAIQAGMASADLADALGAGGLAGALDVAVGALDALMVWISTKNPILAGLTLLASGISYVANLISGKAKEAEREAAESQRRGEKLRQQGLDALRPFGQQMAEALKSNNFDDFGQALKDKLDDQILTAIIEATALSGNKTIQNQMEGLQRILADGLDDDEVARLGIRRQEIMRSAEEALQDTKRQLALAGITFGETGAATVATEQKRQSGLSVAIKQITTRQADELAFVLRTTQGLSQQIAINTDRSASSLEEWLPFISERLDNIDRLPGAAAAVNGGGAEDNIRADRLAAGANFMDFNVVALPSG